MHWK